MATMRSINGPVGDVYTEIDGQADDISELSNDIESQMRALLSEFAADPNDEVVYFKVFKEEKGKPRPSECFKANMGELDNVSDRIRDGYGSGSYLINIIKNGKLFKKLRYDILAPAPKPEPVAASSELSGVLNAMAAQNREMFAQLKDVMLQAGGKAALPTDPMQTMESMLKIMASMQQVMQPARSGSNIDDIIKTVELVQSLKGNDSGGDGSNIWDVVKSLAPTIIEGVKMLPQAQAPRPAAIPQMIGQNQVVTPQPAPEAQPAINPMIKFYLGILVDRARNHSDVDLQAENVLDTVRDPETIRAYILAPDAIDNAIKIIPEIANYRGWFNALQESVRQLMDAPLTDEDSTT